jgi:hypothetical protein
MSSLLLSALAKLDDSVCVLQGCLERLGAGLEVSQDQFVRNLTQVRKNADAVCELVRTQNPDVSWTDRQSLEKLIQDLEGAEAGRKELRCRKLLELAEELNAGTITHRLKSRVTALEALRDSAVRELQAEAAKEEPQDLPGPQAFAWMQWACGLHENANAGRFSELEREFPELVGFVAEMEESYWQPRESAHEIPEQVAIDEASFVPQATTQRQPPQLAESAPAFAARYGHLSAAKASQVEGAAPTTAAAAAAAQVPEALTVESPLAATADSDSDVARILAAVAAHRINRPVAIGRPPQTTAERSAEAAAPRSLESKETTFQLYSSVDAEPVEGERKGFRLNRSVLITIGATAAIVLAMVGISAVSGNVIGKRGSSSATTASDSAKDTSATTPASPVSDLELVGQIEQRLKAIKGSSIYVTVQHGTAILQGEVPSEGALSTAEELTLQSSQIKVVRNRLQIEKAGALHSASGPTKPNPVNAE